ncbi:MAG: hypothetical protein NTX17_02665 [Candidatus Eisenbacteria bacterium]|nr:hypothetical protein [Candidatus Eisenbacteria bacterium]
MRSRNRAVLVCLVCAAAVLVFLLTFLQGCRKERAGFERNLAPETFLSSVPLDSSYVFYRVKLYWAGMDPDGEVVGYYYAVLDSNLIPAESSWVWTTETEMELSLLANNPEMLGHRFYCRAVDNRGLADPSPAFVFFYARDFHLPKITFTRSYAVTPEGETVPLTAATVAQLTDSTPGDTIPTHSVLNFSWRGWDDDPGGYVTGYLYRTSDDAQYRGGTLADTSYSFSVTKNGMLNFEVVALDDAGAMSRRDSLRYFVVDNDPDTWIIPPCDTCCEGQGGRGFTRGGSIPGCNGDTLRLTGSVSISFSWDGWDKDGYVVGWTHRLLRAGGGPAYAFTSQKTWQIAESASGNYKFLVRARDNEGKEDGTPASVNFSLNCAPFFFGERRSCSSTDGVLETCDKPCTATLVDLGGGVYGVSISCTACDMETSPTLLVYRVDVNGREGIWRDASASGPLEIVLAPVDGLHSGSNKIVIWARDKEPDGSAGRMSANGQEFDITIP